MKVLLDTDGENQAVRMFLIMYGTQSCTVAKMKEHLRLAGYPYWPAWTEKEDAQGHLTKGGAQSWIRHLINLEPAMATAAHPAALQQRVAPWMQECFGPEIASDLVERNHRFLEEALELVQSTGCTPSEAHQLVDYVFGRPVGEPRQEAGGVMITLSAWGLAAQIDIHEAGEIELARINVPETVAKIRAKQAAKPKHSPLPQSIATKVCNWHQQNEHGDHWSACAGHEFTINDGTPSENHMTNCCFCGKEIVEHLWTDDDGGDSNV